MRIVYDTNALISATIWKSSFAYKSLHSALEKDEKIIISTEIIEEYSEVLVKDFKYTQTKAEDLIMVILYLFFLVYPKIKFDAVKDDPDDNIVLECAVEGNADYIVTMDNHLLKLKEFKGIKIITPKEFLEILGE